MGREGSAPSRNGTVSRDGRQAKGTVRSFHVFADNDPSNGDTLLLLPSPAVS